MGWVALGTSDGRACTCDPGNHLVGNTSDIWSIVYLGCYLFGDVDSMYIQSWDQQHQTNLRQVCKGRIGEKGVVWGIYKERRSPGLK